MLFVVYSIFGWLDKEGNLNTVLLEQILKLHSKGSGLYPWGCTPGFRGGSVAPFKKAFLGI